ncbi:hypothetical protein BT93_F1008 [Corymbia citriodora subsp. variegata]|nr:hypothetical protein BT93_F1008 [Corymbia citriodora subsp. variegata]
MASQHPNSQVSSVSLDIPPQGGSECFDDDGRLKRTGTVWTASAHIINAVIGSGVLSLAWATAQLGWVAGPVVMFLFASVTYYTSTLLATSYRSGDPVTGKRNYTYMDAVSANLGMSHLHSCSRSYPYANVGGMSNHVVLGVKISSLIKFSMWVQSQTLWAGSIREPHWGCHRLHHCIFH